ncbi:E3 SUMO-protein ligase RanBP2, variant 2 [Bonamia ostreae]|uniref:E3 SUMO-protein ligase RanBP2, variant 2 n=1 Tax=Bonamia ostreae TaxID=126728 RepID=A0ABV2AUS0_9EUKA
MESELSKKINKKIDEKISSKIITGEEDENLIYKQKVKLYRFAPETKEWKERGIGFFTFLQHKEKHSVRAVLREDKTFKVRLNHSSLAKI